MQRNQRRHWPARAHRNLAQQQRVEIERLQSNANLERGMPHIVEPRDGDLTARRGDVGGRRQRAAEIDGELTRRVALLVALVEVGAGGEQLAERVEAACERRLVAGGEAVDVGQAKVGAGRQQRSRAGLRAETISVARRRTGAAHSRRRAIGGRRRRQD